MEPYLVDQPVYEELAGRFLALSKLFHQLGEPKNTQRLLESMVVGEPQVFHEFVEQLDFPFPPLGKCPWLQDVISRVICTTDVITEYWVRAPLTRAQMQVYLGIVRAHPGELVVYADGRLVPGTSFLAELQAAGLVTPKPYKQTTCVFQPVLSPPERICL